MIHRLALFMGGTGAAGVLAVALAMGGFGTTLNNSPDAFAPGANSALAGGLRADAPTDQSTMPTSLGGGAQDGTKKVIDTVYVLPAPAPAVVHGGRPANDANQPADQPRDPGDDNNGGNQAGDDQDDDSSVDEDEGSEDDAEDSNDDEDQAGEDDQSNDGSDSDDGEDDGGSEPGDD